jgi:hypothetical protein
MASIGIIIARRGRGTVTAASAIALCLSGCATGQLQIGRASEMVKAGRATTDASRTMVTDTIASHRRFVAELAALDPNCDLPDPKILLGRSAWGGCVTGPADPGTTLRGPSRAYAKLSLATINGAIAYLDAIDAIATRKPIDIAGTLEDARSDLSGALDEINTLAGTKLALPISGDQLGAAKQLLDLLSELISVADQVRDLKKVEAQLDKGEFDTSIAKLSAVTDAWTGALAIAVAEEDAQIDSVRTLQAQRMRAVCPPKSDSQCPFRAFSAGDRDEFRAYAQRKLTAIERQAQIEVLKVKMPELMAAFITAHQAYRDLLFDPQNTKLTPAERKLRAQIIRHQLLSAIKGLLAIVALF